MDPTTPQHSVRPQSSLPQRLMTDQMQGSTAPGSSVHSLHQPSYLDEIYQDSDYMTSGFDFNSSASNFETSEVEIVSEGKTEASGTNNV